MNPDQGFLLKNLQNMCDYIRQETDKKAALIKKEAIKDAELGIGNYLYRKIKNG